MKKITELEEDRERIRDLFNKAMIKIEKLQGGNKMDNPSKPTQAELISEYETY